MKNRILTLIIFFIYSSLYSQIDYFTLNQIKIAEAKKIESKFNSKKDSVKNKYSYFDTKYDLAQPVKYQRSRIGNFPASSVLYFYSKNDSIVREITHHWKVKFDKDLSQSEKIEIYNSEFDKIIKLISQYIGEPNPNQGILISKPEDIVIGNEQTIRNERQVKWENKNYKIVTYLVWTEKHGESLTTKIYFIE